MNYRVFEGFKLKKQPEISRYNKSVKEKHIKKIDNLAHREELLEKIVLEKVRRHLDFIKKRKSYFNRVRSL